jgi:hypothetical protein
MMRVHTKVVWQWRNGVLVELPEEGESYWYEGPVALAGSGTPVSRITHYRGRSDTGTVDGTPTWIAAEDTPFSVTVGTAFRIRIGVENTGTASDTITAPDTTRGINRCGHTEVAFATYAAIINGADAGSSTDATDVTTQRLTSGTGSFATGSAGYDENETLSCAVANGNFTEVEFGVNLTGGASTIGVGGGESWTFQASGLTNDSLNVPTFTTPDTNGSDFQHGNQLGGAGQAVADSATISMTTEAHIRADNLVVVAVTCDNNGTTDGDLSEISGVTCGGVAMTKAAELTNGQGAAKAGVTTSVWWLQHTAQIDSGSTITATFTTNTNSGDANTIQAREFIVASGKTVSVENTNTQVTDAAAQPASLDCTTSNIECLRVCAHGFENTIASANRAFSVLASNRAWSLWWTAGNLLRSSATGTATTAMSSIVEATISTGTGAAAQCGAIPSVTPEWSQVYVAFKAEAAGGNQDGDGSAVGRAIVTGVGISTNSQAGSAVGRAIVTAVGDGQTALVGSAVGTSTCTAVGISFSSQAGSAVGTSTCTAVGESTSAQAGSAVGTSTCTAVSEATSAQAGSAVGTSTTAAVGISTADAVGSAVGTSTANAEFDPGLTTGSAVGTSTCTAVGESTSAQAGAAVGTSTCTATGAPLFSAVGAAVGTSTCTAVGQSTANSVGACVGTSTAAAVGEEVAAAEPTGQEAPFGRREFGTAPFGPIPIVVVSDYEDGAGSADGHSTAAATGISTNSQAGSAVGTSTATAVGESTNAQAGAAVGHSTAAAIGESGADAVGGAVGHSTAAAAGDGQTSLVGSAVGHSTASSVGESTSTQVGSAVGHSTATAVGESSADAVGSAVGHSTAEAIFAAEGDAAGTAIGTATATAVGEDVQEAVGSAVGTSTCTADGAPFADAAGLELVEFFAEAPFGQRRFGGAPFGPRIERQVLIPISGHSHAEAESVEYGSFGECAGEAVGSATATGVITRRAKPVRIGYGVPMARRGATGLVSRASTTITSRKRGATETVSKAAVMGQRTPRSTTEVF